MDKLVQGVSYRWNIWEESSSDSFLAGWVIHSSKRNYHYRLSIIYAKLEDSGTFNCSTTHGQHNSLAITVTRLSCPHIHTSDTLRVNTSNTNIGTIVSFSCPTGFVLLGDATRECRDDGKDTPEKVETDHTNTNQAPGAPPSLPAAGRYSVHPWRSPRPT